MEKDGGQLRAGYRELAEALWEPLLGGLFTESRADARRVGLGSFHAAPGRPLVGPWSASFVTSADEHKRVLLNAATRLRTALETFAGPADAFQTDKREAEPGATSPSLWRTVTLGGTWAHSEWKIPAPTGTIKHY